MPTRWEDVGRGHPRPVTLAARILAARTRPGVHKVDVFWSGGKPTSLRVTFRAPVETLDAVTVALASQRHNATLTVTADGTEIEWSVSEPLDP